jgi:nucleoid DNA-binding protein
MQLKRGAAIATGTVFFLGTIGLVFSQRTGGPAPAAENHLAKDVAARAKLPVKTVQAVLDALAPEILVQIKHGEIVQIPKLGKIRLVQVAEHKDLEKGTGRVINVPARNFVILDTDAEVERAANAAGVVPSEVVREFEYNILPGQTPSQRTESGQTPSLRTESLKTRSLRTQGR